MWKNGKANTQLITFSRALQHSEMSTMLWDIVPNHLNAKEVSTMQGEFANLPSLNTVHYLSLISLSFGGLFRVVVGLGPFFLGNKWQQRNPLKYRCDLLRIFPCGLSKQTLFFQTGLNGTGVSYELLSSPPPHI